MHTGHTTNRYAGNPAAVFALKPHLVWCPKYRRKVLTGQPPDRSCRATPAGVDHQVDGSSTAPALKVIKKNGCPSH